MGFVPDFSAPSASLCLCGGFTRAFSLHEIFRVEGAIAHRFVRTVKPHAVRDAAVLLVVSTRRSSRIDLGDLRRGDSVTLSGQWLRGGRFEADGIESVNSRR